MLDPTFSGELVPGMSMQLSIALQGGELLELPCMIINRDSDQLLLQPAEHPCHPDTFNLNSSWILHQEYHNCIISFQLEDLVLQAEGQISARISSSHCLQKTRSNDRADILLKITEWPATSRQPNVQQSFEQHVSLNQNGMEISVPHPLHSGQLLQITLCRPESPGEKLQTTVEVLRVKPCIEGHFSGIMRFTNLTLEDKRLLERWSLSGHFMQLHKRVQVLGHLFSPSLKNNH